MEATFYPCRQEGGKIIAFAAVVVTQGIIVRGFRIVDGENGLFAAVPSRVSNVEGKARFYDQVTFSDPEMRKRFLSELLDDYLHWLETQDGRQGVKHEESETETVPF